MKIKTGEGQLGGGAELFFISCGDGPNAQLKLVSWSTFTPTS